ncbi:hypothetical protein PINS_up008441 [Pythium insidiosum]|nr:hypothetical protein PINS_up008441 [Pythium insidiosum]
MNVFPPQFPPDWIPAHALELLTFKNDVLKCLKVSKVSPSGETRDPGFALMTDPHQLVAAIIGVFNTGGCSVVVADYERILSCPIEKLHAAGQAVYDLFLRQQSWKMITAAAKSSLHGLVDGSDLQKLAEKYMGHTKEQVVEMREELARQKAMAMSLETYLQDLADEKTRLEAEIAARGAASEAPRQQRAQTPVEPETSASRSQARSSTARPTTQKTEGRKTAESSSWKQMTERDVKPDLPEQKFSPASANVESVITDYLTDIYEKCVAQMQGVTCLTILYSERYWAPFKIDAYPNLRLPS